MKLSVRTGRERLVGETYAVSNAASPCPREWKLLTVVIVDRNKEVEVPDHVVDVICELLQSDFENLGGNVRGFRAMILHQSYVGECSLVTNYRHDMTYQVIVPAAS